MSATKNNALAGMVLIVLVFLNSVILETALTYNTNWYWLLVITLPLLIISLLSRKKLS